MIAGSVLWPVGAKAPSAGEHDEVRIGARFVADALSEMMSDAPIHNLSSMNRFASCGSSKRSRALIAVSDNGSELEAPPATASSCARGCVPFRGRAWQRIEGRRRASAGSPRFLLTHGEIDVGAYGLSWVFEGDGVS